MDDKTKGAWIIHHTKKLQTVTTQDFDKLAFSGKCGLMLSSMATESEIRVPLRKVEALARANNISPRGELPSILIELERHRLVQRVGDHVEILGLSSYSVLQHTVTIFEDGEPSIEEKAVLDLAESVSERPKLEKELVEYASDTFKLPNVDVNDLLQKSETIGFFDVEGTHRDDRIIFNGNLFRAEDIQKINAVLSTISEKEARSLRELNELLELNGCVQLTRAIQIIGETLFKKVHSIGMYDVSQIGNESGTHYFVTRPAAFSKFTSSFADDAFDHAKALVAALTYGMTVSTPGRGQIQMIAALMKKLIAGEWIGPATAIGSDYQALEMRGVVVVKPHAGTMYYMKLLKPEVGKLALSVILEGDASTEAILQLPNAAMNTFVEPEVNRTITRKNVTEPLRKSIKGMLVELRTGGFKK